MLSIKKARSSLTRPVGSDLVENLFEKGWTYIRTVVDVVREPILILDKNLRVMAANEPFYETFRVERKNTENKSVYELGNGQWNIPSLKKLLENILPKHTFFKGFEVSHIFPSIGRKDMILNARQIFFRKDTAGEIFPPIILLAIEDITEMVSVAAKLAAHTSQMESGLSGRTEKMEIHIGKLEKEISKLKKKK